MTAIVIGNGQITVGVAEYYSLKYKAKNSGDEVIICHVANDRDIICQGQYDDLSLNTVTYGSVTEFVAAFNDIINTAALVDVGSIASDTSSIKEDISYPDTPFGAKVAVGVAAVKVKDVVKPGYIYIRADTQNSENVFVGDSGVTDDDGELLEPGDRTFYEIDDLSKIYIIAGGANQNVYIGGVYKN